jgi:hypothetical protein
MPFGVESGAIKGDDAAGFLTAVLQGVQSKRRDAGGGRRIEHPEYAALEPRRIVDRIGKVIHG